MSVGHRVMPVVLVVLAVLVQVSIVQRIEVGDASPDLIVLVIVSLALLTNSVEGAAYGFLGGILVAMFVALPLGPHAMILTLVGYWAGRWAEQLVTDEHPLPPLLAAIFATLAMQMGRPLIEFLVNPAVNGTDGIWSEAAIVAALNGALAIPVYVGVRRMLLVGAEREPRGSEMAVDA